MPATLDYRFEDLPLVIENGFSAGYIEGTAEIAYYDDGEWFIRTISITCYKDGKTGSFELEPNTHLHLTIFDLLENSHYSGCIEGEVQRALDDDSVTRRTDRQEHSTHHLALAGV